MIQPTPSNLVSTEIQSVQSNSTPIHRLPEYNLGSVFYVSDQQYNVPALRSPGIRTMRLISTIRNVVVIIGLVPFAWILRDGLGPDSRTSSGLEAISQCLKTFYSGPILIGLVALSILCRLPGRKER